MSDTKFILEEQRMPKFWYNINADMPVPMSPVLHPQTKEPVSPEFLSVIQPISLINQDASTERYIEIPEPVREIYKQWRPSPLHRARRLEKLLDTPAHIYYKNEGVSPVGSHKPNTAVAQVFFAKHDGVKALTTETGAGQWGSSLAMACNFFGLQLEVYMVRISYQQKPYRRNLMETYGAQVFASPSDRTDCGRKLLAQDANHPGSLGTAISEGIEAAVTSGGAKKYSLGSCLPHVLLHQTIIGEEVLLQMEMAGEYPDIVIGCAGGGSNFAGIAFPFVRENLRNGKKTRIIAVEPTACPTLTRGAFTYDYADAVGMAPIIKMYTLGHSFVPSRIHAGGLRYHGMSPMVSHALKLGLIEAEAYHQTKVFEAATLFAQTEGLIPAPESAHAIAAVAKEAVAARDAGEKRVLLFNLSGHGLLDLTAYETYLTGKLQDV